MKAYIFAVLLFTIVSSQNLRLYNNEEILNGLETQVGTSCLQNPSFVISSFDVTPWPPTLNIELAVNMTGTFAASVFVNQLSIGTNYNRQNWNYQHANVNSNFNQGQVYSFNFNTQSGQNSGSYLKQVTLSNQNGQGNYQHLSCWQFSYQL